MQQKLGRSPRWIGVRDSSVLKPATHLLITQLVCSLKSRAEIQSDDSSFLNSQRTDVDLVDVAEAVAGVAEAVC